MCLFSFGKLFCNLYILSLRLIIAFILLEHHSCNIYVLQIVRILSGAMTTLSAVDPLNQLKMFVTSYLASWTDSTCGEQAPSSLARTTTSTLGKLWCLASSHRYETKGLTLKTGLDWECVYSTLAGWEIQAVTVF